MIYENFLKCEPKCSIKNNQYFLLNDTAVTTLQKPNGETTYLTYCGHCPYRNMFLHMCIYMQECI